VNSRTFRLPPERPVFSSVLALEGPAGRVGGRFDSITVRDGVFEGRTLDGRLIQAPIEQVRSVDINRLNVGGTVLIIVGALLAAATAVLLWEGRSRSMVVEGRALRIRGRVVVASSSTSDGWRGTAVPATGSLPAATRQALAELWANVARAEHASVPAFARLSLTLVPWGAPARLVEDAHRAALDEIEHARLAFALASVYAGETVGPGPLADLLDAPAVTASSLVALATESLVDGCFLEGVAAAAAREALAQARDPAVRAVLGVIARDERAHAELAWQVLTWCCDVGGRSVLDAVRARDAPTPPALGPAEAPTLSQADLAAHGWVAPAAWRALARRTHGEVTARLAALSAEEAHARDAPAA
jgi:hypothetical protein